MKNLSINEAWNEAAGFVKREFHLLFLISFGLIALPAVMLQAVAPTAAAGQPPEPGLWMLLIIPVVVVSIIGSLTVTVMAVERSSDARSAFGRAVRRLPFLFAAVALMALIGVVAGLPLMVVIGLLAGSETAGVAAAMAVAGIIVLIVSVRMIMLNPVGATEPIGPVAILRRSWRLTAGHFWKLLGFILIVLIVFLVLTLAVGAVFGTLVILAAGPPQTSGLSNVLILLLNGILSAILGVFVTTTIARIYVQLSGGGTSGS